MVEMLMAKIIIFPDCKLTGIAGTNPELYPVFEPWTCGKMHHTRKSVSSSRPALHFASAFCPIESTGA